MKFFSLLRGDRKEGNRNERTIGRSPDPRGIVTHELISANIVMSANLAFVAAFLEKHQIPFFLIGSIHQQCYRVGVLEQNRNALCTMLSQLRDDTIAVTIRSGATVIVDNVSISEMDRANLEKTLRVATLIKASKHYVDASGRILFGMMHGCEIEILSASEHDYKCSHYNPVFSRIDEAYLHDRCAVRIGTRSYSTPRVLVQPSAINFHEPIDVVYTWVNHRDPHWQEKKNRYLEQTAPAETLHPTAHHPARFWDCDELKYSLRSVAMFACFVRTIFIVTDDQVPDWLNTEHPAIRMVRHREIFSDTTVLPVFNSHAIETQLHHIPKLSEYFLYMNDDIFFGRAVSSSDFVLGNGVSRNFYSSASDIPIGPVQPYDRPFDAAAKNNRRVIKNLFGVVESRKLRHVAFSLRKSLIHELEAAIPEDFRRTMGHRFRHPEDISVASSLASHYAYHLGRAVPAKIASSYVGLDDSESSTKLDTLLKLPERKRPKMFCLNVVGEADSRLDTISGELQSFLQRWFPHKSEYER